VQQETETRLERQTDRQTDRHSTPLYSQSRNQGAYMTSVEAVTRG